MGPSEVTETLGPSVAGTTGVYLPCPAADLLLYWLWHSEQISTRQGALGGILFWNLSWCLDFKLGTCQSAAIWEIGFLSFIKCPLCLGGSIKYHSIFALKYSWLEHKMGLYDCTSKAHNCILSWTFDIFIFGQQNYYLFNPQSTYLFCR